MALRQLAIRDKKTGFHLGYSRLHAYQQCPRAYDYTYNMNLRGGSNAAMRRGTAFHNTLEVCGNRKILTGKTLPLGKAEKLARYFAEQENLAPSDATKVVQGVMHWHTAIYPNLNPIVVEVPFEIERGGYIITGRIDWVEADGWIIDHKFSFDTWAESRARYNFQPVIYQWAALDQLEGQFGITYRGFAWHITRTQPTPKTQTIEVARMSQAESDWYEDSLAKFGRAMQVGPYPAHPNEANCAYCSHKDICNPPKFSLQVRSFGEDHVDDGMDFL